MFPYSYLIGKGQDDDGRCLEISERRLRHLLRPFLLEVEMDEEWYLKVNTDVRDAVRSGKIASARDHYADDGFFEDRLPRPVTVDEEWYLQTYQDVADAIRAGKFLTSQQHFAVDGFKEGRLPSPEWTLRSDRAAKMRKQLRAA